MSTTAEILKQFLSEHIVSEIDIRAIEVVELESTLSPVDAAKILWENNVVGAPVWDDVNKKYIGFFEMRDILSAVVATAKAEKEDASISNGNHDGINVNGSSRSIHNAGVNMDRYNECMVKELSSPTKDGKKVFVETRGADDKTISYLAARNHFTFCRENSTLTTVCECLSKKHCHRVPVLNDKTEKCDKIISQSALIKFISSNCPHDKLQDTIVEAGMPYKKDVVQIIDTASASEAFTLLDNKRLSGIAVVDEEGKLVGNTSARDIKLAAIDEGKIAMDMDILSYLAKVRQGVHRKSERYPCCHIHEDATVSHVVNLLAKTGYHRVFVVDENIRPIGVISVTDITNFATAEEA
jgi:CBS domain-containing protein